MDGQLLSQALVRLSGQDLRLVYALLCKTNIIKLISTKTKDIISSEESNHFSLNVEQEANKLQTMTDEELRLSLFLELTKITQLKGGRYDLQKEIEDKCQEIVDWSFLQFQKKNKEFLAYFSANDMTKLEAMINWQMNQVFKELDLKLTNLSEKEQDELANKVLGYVNALPNEQQEKIKEKLGVQEISDKVVKKVIAQSGASILFATIVEVSGFAFYTTITSGLAALAGILGITLPFGAYTTLTSAVAFLANPLFILPMILGGGVLLVNHQNKSLRRGLVPIVLMQISLPYLSSPEISYQDLTVISKAWNTRFNAYIHLHDELVVNYGNQNTLDKQIYDLNVKLQARELKKKDLEAEISSLKNNIKSLLKDDKQRPYFEHLTSQLHSEQIEIRNLEEQITFEKRYSNSFFSSIITAFKTGNYQSQINTRRRKIESIFNQMVEAVLKKKVIYATESVNQVKVYELEINKLLDQISSLQVDITNKRIELSNLKVKERSTKNKMKNSESETYGLEHIVMD